MGIKVCKFGGTSLADAAQMRKVQKIVESDPNRRFVVPSAPGKRSSEDRKITDLLYLCHGHAQQRIAFDDVFGLIAERFKQIIDDLELDLDLSPQLEEVQRDIARYAEDGDSAEFAASRGEYLNGHVMAALLGADFIDAADVIRFTDKGKLDRETTNTLLKDRLGKLERAVVPGFYGSDASGKVRTFSRGGSDVTGAVVAAAVGAEAYENWTDVSGLLMADPRIIDNPKTIDVITYTELRELAYMGATVIHEHAIFPVREAGIPVNIRNTNEPDHPGTRIVSNAAPITHKGNISGIAGRKDFTVIALEKAMMGNEVGFGRRVLEALENYGINYEHTPTGIDTMSVVVGDEELGDKTDRVVETIRVECNPDNIEVQPGMALIATVGRGMASTPGIAARLFNALADANINIRMIDQGSSEINIIVGVENHDFEDALRTIYNVFVYE